MAIYEKKYEKKYLLKCLKELKTSNWNISNLHTLDKHFSKFCKQIKTEEISLLRYGEVFLRECVKDVSSINVDNSKDFILKVYSFIDEIELPVAIVIIACIVKIAISSVEGQVDYNNLKEVTE